MSQLNKLLFLSTLVCGLALPQSIALASSRQIEQAKEFYQQDRYPAAIKLLETAIEQERGNPRLRAIALRNLALIYQRLGEWQQATATLSEAEQIIATIDDGFESHLLAQVLEVQGQVELSLVR
ncbi:tetratricopeptide repeat protein, partial [Pleurocapsales cyanobacterium LEGE 10410]|nr:tetratricopeptide repeat protein [Pleurocapsales cyanobacterium LEGE 10410]